MKNNSKKLGGWKLGAIFTVMGITVLGISYFINNSYKTESQSVTEQEVTAYEKILNNHPYTKALALGGKVEKEDGEVEKENEENETDGPRLAAMQNFLQTMDPALGYVPSERIRDVYEMLDQGKYQRQLGGQQSAAAAINWIERGPNNVGGRTRAILFDPNDLTNKKVWAGGVGGGLWYTNDITANTISWTKVNDLWDNIGITSLAASKLDPKTFYASTGEGWGGIDQIRGAGIWKTTDAGATWTRLTSTLTTKFYYVQKVVVHPVTGDVYAATGNGLIRSQDAGATWATVLSFGAAADFEITADNVLFVAFGVQSAGSIYKSTSGSAGSWTKVSTVANGFPSNPIRRVELATAPSNANVVYAILEDAGTADVLDIYITKDQGQTWVKVTKPVDLDTGVRPSYTRGQAWYDLSIAVDPTNDSTLVVGGVDLFKSTTGGKTWTQISSWTGNGFPLVHADQHTAVYRPGSSAEMLFGCDGGIYYTSTLTAAKPAFKTRNTGYNVTQFYGCALHPTAGSNYCLAGAQDNNTQKFTTAGIGNTSTATGGDGCFCFIDQDEPNIQITSYVYNKYYISTNSGSSFGGTILNDANTGSFVNPSDYDDVMNILYTANSTSKLYRVINVGKTAVTQTIVTNFGSTVSHIRVSPYAPTGTSTIFVGTDGGKVFMITNAQGTSFVSKALATPGVGSVSCIEIGASDNELLATYSNYGVKSVYYSSNGGTSWVSKEGNLPDMPVRWALFNPNDRKQVILATEVGVWATDDISAAAPQWAPANNGLANVRTDMLQIRKSDNTVIAATHGRGLFSTTSFAINGINEVATDMGISIFPNPASTEVNINFSQVKANSLSIVNLKGQVVLEKQQVNESEKLDVSEFVSGVYLLKLKLINGKQVVQKLIIKQ